MSNRTFINTIFGTWIILQSYIENGKVYYVAKDTQTDLIAILESYHIQRMINKGL